jgi:hypothetical protein
MLQLSGKKKGGNRKAVGKRCTMQSSYLEYSLVAADTLADSGHGACVKWEDIIHNHEANGAALGEGSHRNFRRLST